MVLDPRQEHKTEMDISTQRLHIYCGLQVSFIENFKIFAKVNSK